MLKEKSIKVIDLIGWNYYISNRGCVHGVKNGVDFIIARNREMIRARAVEPPFTTVRMHSNLSAEQMADILKDGFLQRLVEQHLF